jgi:hypothetical protein
MWLEMHSMGLLLSGSVAHMVPARSQLGAAACQCTRRPLPLHSSIKGSTFKQLLHMCQSYKGQACVVLRVDMLGGVQARQTRPSLAASAMSACKCCKTHLVRFQVKMQTTASGNAAVMLAGKATYCNCQYGLVRCSR